MNFWFSRACGEITFNGLWFRGNPIKYYSADGQKYYEFEWFKFNG